MYKNDYEGFLRTLAAQCDEDLAYFENKHTLLNVCSIIGNFASQHVSNSITYYQKIIRNNIWYFPTIHDVDIPSFLVRWSKVHSSYLKLADEIFSILSESKSIHSLATSTLLTRTIQSETMRGWVGKRSPSGLDALLDSRIAKLNELLHSFDDDEIDDILSCGGIYTGKSEFITAEQEMISLFRIYHHEIGQELTLEMLPKPNRELQLLLRNYCRYSIKEFNEKYNNLYGYLSKEHKEKNAVKDTVSIVTKHLAKLEVDKREFVWELLDEIKALNYLNLNLEVKYSFKGWAGFMHILVFIACKEVTKSDDVYTMRSMLMEREV